MDIHTFGKLVNDGYIVPFVRKDWLNRVPELHSRAELDVIREKMTVPLEDNSDAPVGDWRMKALLNQAEERRTASSPDRIHQVSFSSGTNSPFQGCIFYIVSSGELEMENAGIGWIAAIIIGGLAGWFAEMFMKSNTGIIMNVILGIVGAVIANALLSIFGVILTGWLGYLVAGFIGACILIAVGRMFRGSKAV